jgi:hypothetical protein
MTGRAFEFLFLSWALGTLAVHFNYEQDVVAFEHVQREAQVRAIRHALRNVDPALLYAPAIVPVVPVPLSDCFSATDPACVPFEELLAPPLGEALGDPFGSLGWDLQLETPDQLDELERRLRDLYIHELRRRGVVWSA